MTAPISGALAFLALLMAAGCGQSGPKAAVAKAATREGCDRNANPSTFASAVLAATDGQTICLGSGDYGQWTGTAKAITIRPQSGASPTMTFDFGATAANLTIDGGHANYDSNSPGIDIGPSFFDAGSKNITVENVAATARGAFFVLDIRTDGPGIVIKGNVFHDMLYPNTVTGAVRILPPDMVPASNIVVEANLFRDMGADGIDGGPGTILANDFANVDSEKQPHDPRHTDVIQMGNGPDVIRGNFVHNGCIQGIDAFDGTASNVIEDNVIVGCSVHSLVLAGDTPASTVEHNTVVGNPAGALLECGSKPGEGPSVTKILDNILQGGVGSSGVPCQPSEVNHNLFYPGTSMSALNGSGNLGTTPRFVGGADPNTYAGYALARRSPGAGAASDGADIGARVERYPRPRTLDARY